MLLVSRVCGVSDLWCLGSMVNHFKHQTDVASAYILSIFRTDVGYPADKDSSQGQLVERPT